MYELKLINSENEIKHLKLNEVKKQIHNKPVSHAYPPAGKQMNVEVQIIDICLKQIHSAHIMHTNQLVRITYTIQQSSCLANKLNTCQHSQFDNLNFIIVQLR